MSFVLDASVASCWAFIDEDHRIARLALDQITRHNALVPCIWWFEVRNSLIINERRGRIDQAGTALFLIRLSELAITIDHAPEELSVINLARKHNLTVYDAGYIELAHRKALPLASLDSAIIRAAKAENVPLIGIDS